MTLSGANWQPGESVHIFVNDDKGESWSRNVDVVAAADGTIEDRFNLPDWFVARYSVTATGPLSGTATTSFTDGNVKVASAAGRHFDYQATPYSLASCSTGGGSAATKTADANGSTNGVGSNESLLIVANPTANAPNASATFSHWTFPGTPAVQLAAGYSATDRTICVVGFQNGSRDLVGNYAAAPANSAPTVAAANASVTVNEGQAAANTGTYSDANAGDEVVVSASVGSVTKTGTNSGTWSWSYATTDGPDNGQTVTITANDGTVSSTATFTLTVNNVAPTVALSGDASANEGQTKTYSFTVTDPGTDTFGVSGGYPDCGTGASLVAGSLSTDAGGGSFQCRFPDGPASSTARMQVADSDGAASNVATVGVTVANVAPTVMLSGATSANEGETKTYTYTVSDPGDDPDPAITESCGANGTRVDTPASNSFDCTFPDGPASSTVSVSANDGTDTGSDSEVVTVANVVPTVVLNGAPSANEGETTTYTYTVSDPADVPVITESCGAYGARADTPAPNSFDCTFPDGPASSTVSVSANDGTDTGSDSEVVTVANVVPTVVLTGDAAASEGQTNTYAYTVSDPGDDPNPVVTESCGANGTSVDTLAPNSFDCAFLDGPETSTVSVSANDGADTGNASKLVTVGNVPPTVSLSGAAAADEGQTKTYTYTVTDPGQDTFAAAGGFPSCGTGGDLVADSHATTPSGGTFVCNFPDGPASPSVQVKVDDSDGGPSNVSSVAVTVSNVAPTVSLSGAAAADEGETKSYSYTVTDPGQDGFVAAAGFPKCGVGGDPVSGSHSTTATGGSFQCKFPDGPANLSVQMKVNDTDGAGSNTDSIAVTVSNVAPTVSLSGPAAADEGQTKTYAYTVTDPGQDTFAAADGFPSCGTGGDLVTGSHSTTASGGSFQCSFPDGPANPSVQIKIDDSDGAASNVDSVAVTVGNVAPTVELSASNDLAVDEGSTHTYSYAITDPGQDTVQSVQTSCVGNGDEVAGSDTNTNTGGSFQCRFPDGPAGSAVSAQATDSDGATGAADGQTVTVNNVAPKVTLSGPASANEGETKTYDYTVTDPGDDPDPAITESCGANGTKDDTAATNSFDCRFPDGPASSMVSVSANDGDPSNNTGNDSKGVTVSNVAPTVALSGPASALEGDAKTYSYSVSDPGVDTFAAAAGFPVCGTGGALVGGSHSTTASGGSFQCSFADGPASPSVQMKVNDSDGAESNVDSVALSVSNVAPTITSFTGTDALSGPLSFFLSTYTTVFTDPAAVDTWFADFSFSGGVNQRVPAVGTGFKSGDKVTHAWTSPGCNRSASVKVTDDDGGVSNTMSTTVDVGAGEFLPPMTNQPVTNKLRNGQVLPVKIRITDCNGAPVTNLSPAIRLNEGDQTQVPDDSVVLIVPDSVSSADTSGVMRSVDGNYLYNMRVNVAKLNTDYTVVIYPYGTGNPGQTLRHVIQATK